MILLVTPNYLLTHWGTPWMWVCWEAGAPQRPLVLWPSTGAHLEVPGGMMELGLLQEAETVGNRGPIPRGEDILILNSWSVVTGPSNDQVAGKHLFLCRRFGISLREIVLSELSESLSYRWSGKPSLIKNKANWKSSVNHQVEEFSLQRSKNHNSKNLLKPYGTWCHKNLTL